MSQKNIAIEILKVIKGKRSSQALSFKLGYKSNQVSRWESGHSVMTWKQFIEVCDKEKIAYHRKLRELTLLTMDPRDFKQLILEYFPNYSRAKIAKLMKVSNATITKWLSNKSSPPAETIFKLMKSSNVSYAAFVSGFLPNKKFENAFIEKILSERIAEMSIFDSSLVMDVLISFLETTKAKNGKKPLKEILAEQFLLDTAKAEKLVKELQQKGLIELLDSDQTYRVLVKDKILDTSDSKEKMLEFLNFWFRYHITRMNDPIFFGKRYLHIYKFLFATRKYTETAPTDRGNDKRIHGSFNPWEKRPGYELSGRTFGCDISFFTVPDKPSVL